MNIYLTQKNQQKLCELFDIEYHPMNIDPIVHIGQPIVGWSKGLSLTKEHKEALSKSKKGKLSHNKGKPMSEEQKQKLSQINKGKKLSEESKKKISDASKKQINRNVSGIGPYWKGRKRTEQDIQNRIKNVCKEYVVISPEGNRMVIKNMNKFCREKNLNATHMGAIALGKRRTHKGWKCEQVKKEQK